MEYIKVKWNHSFPDEPVLLYSELDKERREIRKVEIFANGGIGYASVTEETASTKTKLSIEPLPTLERIASDPQFEPAQIAKDEFEEVWSKKRSLDHGVAARNTLAFPSASVEPRS